jgi:hypothetical protein
MRNQPLVAPAGGELLRAGDVASAVGEFMAASPAARRWDVETSFDWAAADAGRLTEGQRSAVRFVTMIEDHLPGYFDLYQRHFPVTGDVAPAEFEHNRELYHFTVRWAFEEDTHARALARYQVASGLADTDALRAELAVEGRKEFTLPFSQPVQYFAYALVTSPTPSCRKRRRSSTTSSCAPWWTSRCSDPF